MAQGHSMLAGAVEGSMMPYLRCTCLCTMAACATIVQLAFCLNLEACHCQVYSSMLWLPSHQSHRLGWSVGYAEVKLCDTLHHKAPMLQICNLPMRAPAGSWAGAECAPMLCKVRGRQVAASLSRCHMHIMYNIPRCMHACISASHTVPSTLQ